MISDRPAVAIIMGSQSDWETMKNAADMLDQLDIGYRIRHKDGGQATATGTSPGCQAATDVVWASATVLKKAGFSGWWSIIAIIPIANWVALMVFASSEWPALRRPSDGGA